MPKREGMGWWDADPASFPLSELTIGALLNRSAYQFGEREAIVTVAYTDLGLNVRWTFTELRERADAMARGLIGLGLQPGSRLAIWASNIPEWLVAEFAAAKAGLILVPVNPTFKSKDLQYVLTDSGAEALLFLPRFRTLELKRELDEIRGSLPLLRHVFAFGDEEPGVDSTEHLLELGKEVGDEALRERESSVNPRDIAQIQYTSGTTGFSKGAQLTHHNIVNNARLFGERWQIGPGDRWCNPMPLFHTAGCGMVTLGALWYGACHLPIVSFEPERTIRTIEKERATIIETVPTMLIKLLEYSERMSFHPTSLRLVGIGGAPTPVGLGQLVRDAWRAELRIVYGLTETSPLITQMALDDPEERLFSTVGRPLPETELRIVTATGDVTVTDGVGEVIVRGYLVMAGYLNQPDATAAVIDADRWFHTGDLGRMDGDGYLTIVGRLKDVIIRGGENIYPAEVEALLLDHPAIQDVAILGVPDRYYGEQACAVVRPTSAISGDTVREWLAQRVSHQKVPKYVLFVDEFPLTPSGKVQKFRLREIALAQLGIDVHVHKKD